MCFNRDGGCKVKISSKRISIILVFVIIFVLSFFVFRSFMLHKDQHATIELTEEYSLKATLKLKSFPGIALQVWLEDQDGKYLGFYRIDKIIDDPVHYVEKRDPSWKTAKLISDKDGIKTFDTIWCIILLTEDGEITIAPKQNKYY